MIKGILFDMDGVLIDAREWHYEALNEALTPFGITIERDSHLSTYDGLPTRNKLEILAKSKGLPEKLHEFINQLKQNYTYEKTVASCKPVFHHQYALSQFKQEGIKMAVCSNSKKDTVNLMMKLSKLDEYLEFYISNEDVAKPKPDPEMYLKGIDRLGLSPQEVLIIEDNDHGIKAARASGAHVMEVGSTDDVNHDRILKQIKMINDKVH